MSQETDLIKERLDLAEVVGEYVQLKRVGGHFKGLCPFHQEKTPSFIVSPDKGIWHCFGCSRGGDLFSFVQEMEGMDFSSALKMLADRAGVQLSGYSPQRSDERVRLYDLLGLAARFYHELLVNHKAGRQAKEYLVERGLKDKTMQEFLLGYAPNSWDGVQSFLRSKGFSEKEMIDSGLVGRSERGRLYDRFRGRAMWPVYDVQGRTVAFGGRIMPWHETGSEGKYINSPETKIYEKRRVVYNLNRAKRVLRQHEPCLVVEGYMDVVMLVQAGVENVVATSGTAFTGEHVQQLKRYTSTLHFAFDADNAGIQAAENATRGAVTYGMRVATILFPPGQDPADVAQKEPDKLKSYLSNTTSIAALLLQRLKAADSALDRQAMLDRVLPFVREVANPVQQGEMVQEIADTLHIPESVVVDKLASSPVSVSREQLPEESAVAGGKVRAGQLLLGLLILDTGVREEFWDQLDDNFFIDESENSLYKQLKHLAEADKGFAGRSADDLIGRLPEHHISLAEGVRRVAEEYLVHVQGGASREAAALVRVLKIGQLEKRLKSLHEKLNQPADEEEKNRLLDEFRAAARELTSVRAQV